MQITYDHSSSGTISEGKWGFNYLFSWLFQRWSSSLTTSVWSVRPIVLSTWSRNSRSTKLTAASTITDANSSNPWARKCRTKAPRHLPSPRPRIEHSGRRVVLWSYTPKETIRLVNNSSSMTALKAFELRSLNHPIWISNICCYCIFLRTGYGLYQTYFSRSLENGLIISRFQLKLSGKNEEEVENATSSWVGGGGANRATFTVFVMGIFQIYPPKQMISMLR